MPRCGLSDSAIEGATDEALVCWERLTLQADAAYQKKLLKPAFDYFLQSQTVIADRLNGRGKVSAEHIRCFVLACQNTAFVAQKLHRRHLCEYYYRQSYRRLEAFLESDARGLRLRQVLCFEINLAQRKYAEYLYRRDRNGETSLSKEFHRIVRRMFQSRWRESSAAANNSWIPQAKQSG